ncbi:MAG: hypothetical protein JJE30_05965 [Desulfuromonadales bacterium]|nr:hypothetical protein [Desulfuromonadales bacterium]
MKILSIVLALVIITALPAMAALTTTNSLVTLRRTALSVATGRIMGSWLMESIIAT